ncbi:MAG: carboxy terminal-processing peptidase [Nonlabens sp.]
MNFLKNNIGLAILTLLIATASCSFTNTIDPGDKEKEELLVNLISHVLKRNHYSPADLTDEFSKEVFENFITDLDPGKRYFLRSDYEEFKQFEFLIDDEIRNSKVELFNLAYDRLIQRQKETEKIFKEVLKEPFDFTREESINVDGEKVPYSIDKNELKEHWRKLIKLSVLNNVYDRTETQKDKPAGAFKDLSELEELARKEIGKNLRENFKSFDDIQRQDFFASYVNAITAYFDPHTNYFPPQNKDRFDIAMSGKLEGIGARLQKKTDYISVLEIISGGPAWRSKQIEVGDQILKVAQENDTVATSIVGMRIVNAVDLIKGPKGTKVTLTLKKVDGTIEDITIVRDVVELEDTYAKAIMTENDGINYGIIDLPKFYFDMEDPNGRASGSDVAQEIERLKSEGMDGLIIDLRNNGGGSLREVIKMMGLFVDQGPVVQVALKDQRTQTLSDDDNGKTLWDGPLVVLVNEFSASASEILAAALQDYERAIILGSKQTFGKGTVQNFENLNRWVRNNEHGDLGALKITTQKFYRINGSSTQMEGVKSDVVAPTRYAYMELGERDEDHPLPYDEIKPAEYRKFNGYSNLPESIEKAQKRVATNSTFDLIDRNAQWLKTQQEDNIIPLNFNQYVERIERLDNETERFEQMSDYKNDLKFKLLENDLAAIEKDSVLKDKRDRWMKGLNKDVYMAEAVNILKDLKLKDIKNKYTIKD